MVPNYYLYILRCRDGTLYIGVTNDMAQRLRRHRQGTGSAYTRAHPPKKIVYHETFDSYRTACRREAQLKKWRRDKKERLILGLKP